MLTCVKDGSWGSLTSVGSYLKSIRAQDNGIVRRSLSSSTESLDSNYSNECKTKTGLFQIPGLKKPADFITIAQISISQCRSMRSDLVSSLHSETPKSPLRMLYALDQISNTVCSVIDAAELCRCVHPGKEWRDAACQAFSIIGEYISELNADVELYSCLDHVSNAVRKSGGEGFTEEQQRMVVLLKAEFERDGIHLPVKERDRLMELHKDLSGLESAFTNNITNHVRNIFSVPKAHVKGILPAQFLQRTDKSLVNDMVSISSDDFIVNTILRHSPDGKTRKEAFVNANTNCEFIKQLLDCQHSLVHYDIILYLIKSFPWVLIA